MFLAHITSLGVFFVASIMVALHFLLMFLRHRLFLRRMKEWDTLRYAAKMIAATDKTANIEIYTKIRKAELLLNNAIDKNDYDLIVKEVISMGLNPKEIGHKKL